jgi:hypothetical protein
MLQCYAIAERICPGHFLQSRAAQAAGLTTPVSNSNKEKTRLGEAGR